MVAMTTSTTVREKRPVGDLPASVVVWAPLAVPGWEVCMWGRGGREEEDEEDEEEGEQGGGGGRGGGRKMQWPAQHSGRRGFTSSCLSPSSTCMERRCVCEGWRGRKEEDEEDEGEGGGRGGGGGGGRRGFTSSCLSPSSTCMERRCVWRVEGGECDSRTNKREYFIPN